MPNSQDRSFRRFDDMCDEELRQILRQDASKPEGEDEDLEQTLYIMEVLAKRRNERGEGRSAEDALDSFKKYYCTNNETNLISETDKPSKKHSYDPWKRIAAAAAVLLLVVGLSKPASAWSFDFWDVIAKWTQETFHFGYFGEETENPEVTTAEGEHPCAGLQAALDEYHITEKLVPTWLPEGYVETMVDIQENPIQRIFFALYQYNDKEIIIQVVDYLGDDPVQIEQSGTLVETYSSADVQYYVFENYDELRTVWTCGNYECYISGSITIEEMKDMVDSISRG